MDRMQLAQLTRQAMEQYAKKSKKFDPDTLGSSCAIASFALRDIFNTYNFPAKVIMCNYKSKRVWFCHHCFVESDGFYYDITLTQFDKRVKKVYVSNQLYYGLYDPRPITFKNISCWPDSQMPYDSKIGYVKKIFNKLQEKCSDG